MEKWEREHILKNLPKLLRDTNCNTVFLSMLMKYGVITLDEKDEIKKQDTESDRAQKMYEILMTKSNSFVILEKCLKKTSQTGAHTTLVSFPQTTSKTIPMVQYNRSTVLGNSSWQTMVYKGSVRFDPCAIKVIQGQEIDIDGAMRDVRILKEVVHENVVQLFTLEERDDLICIALELCDNTLEEYIQKSINAQMPLEEKEVLKQATTGLEYLHECKIIHGNLKPSNILFSTSMFGKCKVKISDFGLAKQIPKDELGVPSKYTHTGFGSWTAPEVLKHTSGLSKSEMLSFQSDIFSLGCVFYYTLTHGQHPFGDPRFCNGHIVDGLSDVTPDEICIAGCKGFLPIIESMISPDFKLRPACLEILKYNAFWSHKKILKFISAVCGVIEQCTSTLVCNGKCWLDCSKQPITCYSNSAWISKLCVSAKDFVLETPETIVDCGVKSLLFTVNKMATNYDKLPEPLQKSLGKLETEFLGYWLDRFPFLITTACHGSARFKNDYRLSKFFNSNQTFIQDRNWLLSPSNYISKSRDDISSLTAKILPKRIQSLEAHQNIPFENFSYTFQLRENNRFADLAVFIGNGQTNISEWLAKNNIDNPSILRGNKGETALHIAVTTGNLAVVEYWLAKGMDPTFCDKCGRNSLHYAGATGKNIVSVTRLLIEHGTDIRSTDLENKTMGHYLPENPNVDQQVFEDWINLVIEFGHTEIFKIQDVRGNSFLHNAIYKMDFSTTALSEILNHVSINLNQVNIFNNTPLMLGALYGRKQDILKCLVEKGSNYSLSNHENRGVLHHCVEGDNVEGLKYFLSLNCDIHAKSMQEEVPHHRLRYSRKRFNELTETLLKFNTNLHATDREGSNIAHVISQNKNISPKEYRRWVRAMVDFDHGHIFKEKNFDGNTPLHCAMYTFNVDRKTLQMLQTKCGIDMNQKDSEGNTLLLLAVQNGRSKETLESIVSLGGDMHLVNNRKRGVLHSSVSNANIEALEFFLQSHECNIGAKDDPGETPIHKIRYAKSKFVEITSILLRQNANLYDTDKDGNTVAHLMGPKVSYSDYKEWANFIINQGHRKLFETKNSLGELPQSF